MTETVTDAHRLRTALQSLVCASDEVLAAVVEGDRVTTLFAIATLRRATRDAVIAGAQPDGATATTAENALRLALAERGAQLDRALRMGECTPETPCQDRADLAGDLLITRLSTHRDAIWWACDPEHGDRPLAVIGYCPWCGRELGPLPVGVRR